MTLTQRLIPLVEKLRAIPPSPGAISEAHTHYWSILTTDLGDVIRKGETGEEFLREMSDLINLGLVDGAVEQGKLISEAAQSPPASEPHLRLQYMTEYVTELITRLNNGDRLQALERDIDAARVDINHKTEEISELQIGRREILLSSNSPPQSSQMGILEQVDQATLESIRTKRSVARGTFLSVQQRRDHAVREQALEKNRARAAALYSILSTEERARVQGINKAIEEAFIRIVDQEQAIRRMEEESRKIDLNDKLSPNEMANRLTSELEYIRDLTKLTAKRLHLQSCPLIRGGEPCFTRKLVAECLERILEFDPRIFYNERVTFHGKPAVLLVPGTGNALYDWKNNRLVVPLCPPSGDHISSIAAGIIEYRIDVDEDKEMVRSYNQIPEYHEIRSVLKLRAQFTKDYTVWMTNEYLGNRILAKGIKDWFEHRIAPPRSEPLTPPDLQSFLFSSEQFRTICTDLEARTGPDAQDTTDEDLWRGSVVSYQQGKYEISAQLLERLLERRPEHLFAYYNLGQVSMKLMNKQRALWAFGEFCKRKPQSWWARVARDHCQRLMRG